MLTLSLDTSSKSCSCALCDGELLLAECYLNAGLTHSRTLTRLIEDALAHAERDTGDIERIAVSVGPGSYTGLRIGLSAAKGMALANGLPCAGVSTLYALAHNLACCDGVICAVLDARVGQVFAALFEGKDGTVSRLTEDDALTLERLGELLPDGAWLVGDGAELVHRRFPEKALRLAPAALRYLRAASVAAAAEHLPDTPAEELVPDYHRLSQAERERAARQHKEDQIS